jgi:glycosyltransferase involved in cell wall biosynthesis
MNSITNNDSSRRPRLVYIVTTTKSLFFFQGFIAELCTSRFDVSVITSPGPGQESIRAEGASIFDVPMNREISLFDDIVSLWRLWRVLRRIHPDITNVGTTKAGLLGGLAAVFAGVPHRIYTLHGLRLETTRGWKRRLLWCTEWIACRCAHQVYCVSQSLRELAIDLKLVGKDKSMAIANGTCNGIDIDRFAPSPERKDDARRLRAKLSIDSKALVVGFVGRLTRDKGIPELYEAFLILSSQFSNLRLLLVGDYESGDPVPSDIRARIDADARVVRTDRVTDTASYYHLMDVLALPTYREGFPYVPLEAQASGIPVVTTVATGARDSLVDGITGFLTPVGDATVLAEAISRLLQDAELRKRMGEAGREWVTRTFDRCIVWAELKRRYMLAFYQHPNPLQRE